MSTPIRFHAKMEDGSVREWCNIGTMGWYARITDTAVWVDWVKNDVMENYLDFVDGTDREGKYGWVKEIEWITPVNYFFGEKLDFKVVIDNFDKCEAHVEVLSSEEIEYLSDLEDDIE